MSGVRAACKEGGMREAKAIRKTAYVGATREQCGNSKESAYVRNREALRGIKVMRIMNTCINSLGGEG